MKNLLLVFALFFTLGNAFGQSVIEATSATTLSPFASATRLLESGTVTSLVGPMASTMASAAARGVAGKEQLKDDLVALNEDMTTGRVRVIEDVRQPALKEFFAEISQDEIQMETINSLVHSGSELHKIATAVTLVLLVD